MKTLKHIIETVIEKEVKLIGKQVSVVRSERSNEAKIRLITVLQTQSDLFEECSFDFFKEWVTDQIERNTLPEMSSGSFITALTDCDGLTSVLNIEDDEEMTAFLRLEMKKARK